MQLSQIGYCEPQTLSFIDPYTTEQTPIKLKIYPKNSKIGKNAEHNMRLESLELMKDENNIDTQTKNLKLDLITDISIRFLTELVADWEGITNEKEKPIKFTKDECFKALKECTELCDAVFRFTNEKLNFQKQTEKS